MAASSEEKTEKPTPKRKKEGRKDGQVPRTPELGGWLGLLVVGLAMGPLLDHELDALRTMMATSLRSAEQPSVPLALTLLGDAGRHVLVSLVVLGSMVLVIGVVAALAQGGFYLSPKLAKPDPKKLNPIQGAKRVLGPHAFWEGAKVMVKSAVVAFLAWGAVKAMMPLVGGLLPIQVVLHQATAEVSRLLLTVAIAGLVMAAADYAMMRRRIGKQLRMSHSEIKREHKQAEGDPLLKGAIRARQLAAARNRMIADVATADVLLVNPTHVAVALRYDPERGAPRVVARGAGAIAARIREVAGAERVPLVQDVPLARALYRHCQVGQEIPRELWAAVAQVLAFVLSRRNAGQHGGEHRTPRRTDELPEVLALSRRRRVAGA
ncbi:EscU/YscU/HrcU family type III secretion system export apparatus switch protein [Nocardioides carbamazepini]|uniref:EscU/YscU/HrcU family type III secretion system export apparatus switch protein n=1 Tax=Nocardioides carbamazepini TaxID=2854259 RepID=UPI00214A3B78|nr:EscU/YscU/HrcU family type III secretion system export apparatus switch protein [Nocardioides carbamazepini]MCR1786351.1 EscU/YscU/HrcU family type III secretion system export apparatus switch protein [Nocardioides carbamazepini]